MNPKSIRLNPVTSLLLAWIVIISSLAASPRPAGAPVSTSSGAPAGIPARGRAFTTAAAPVFPDCSGKTTCTKLQFFLLIDDSGSMFVSDPANQRLAGAKNVLDILARVYYLPAVDARVKDSAIILPDIQVSLIHFSSVVLYNSGWKTINPGSPAEWTTQLKAFEPDLAGKPDYTRQNTDFAPAFQAAAELAAAQPQKTNCPRLVMLFTDGMPDYGKGPLEGAPLTQYMQDLQKKIIQPAFNRTNDRLYVTTFLPYPSTANSWNETYKQDWVDITKDSDQFDPRRVQYVATRDLAARMERIIGATIGDQVTTLIPITGNPQRYTTEIPAMVDSLRLTYYTINTGSSFIVTGPDGAKVSPTGANTSIQVVEIRHPAPSSYQINTTTPGGLFTRLLSFEQITAKLSPASDTLLQFTIPQIGIQLFGPDGLPLAITPQMSLQAAVTQDGQSTTLARTQGSASFTTNWRPLTTDAASVDACVTLTDNQGMTAVLYNGTVGKISIDPLTVQAGQTVNACIPTNEGIRVPLQLINARNQQPAAIDLPVQWSAGLFPASGRPQLNSSIDKVDANSGKYVLHFPATFLKNIQFPVTASASVGKTNYKFFDGNISTSGLPASTTLALTLGVSTRLGDKLSVWLYKAFHPGCINNSTQIVIGRHFFGLFGPTRVQISGRFMDTGNQVSEACIERFAMQLVSLTGGPSSETLSSWTTPETDRAPSTLEFRSPGLGLYAVTVSDHGTNPACSVLASLPTQSILLINDYWEYLIVLILILILIFLVGYLMRRYRKRRFGMELPLILSSIALIAVGVILVNLLVTRTFKCELNCSFLIDRTLNSDSLCKGVSVGPVTIIPGFTIPAIEIVPSINFGLFSSPSVTIPEIDVPTLDFGPFRILPGMNFIDKPLEAVRKFIAWSITLFFAALSLVVAFIARKFMVFVRFLQTPEGRATVLTNLSIWLFIFVVFCGLFFFRFVSGK